MAAGTDDVEHLRQENHRLQLECTKLDGALEAFKDEATNDELRLERLKGQVAAKSTMHLRGESQLASLKDLVGESPHPSRSCVQFLSGRPCPHPTSLGTRDQMPTPDPR